MHYSRVYVSVVMLCHSIYIWSAKWLVRVCVCLRDLPANTMHHTCVSAIVCANIDTYECSSIVHSTRVSRILCAQMPTMARDVWRKQCVYTCSVGDDPGFKCCAIFIVSRLSCFLLCVLI